MTCPLSGATSLTSSSAPPIVTTGGWAGVASGRATFLPTTQRTYEEVEHTHTHSSNQGIRLIHILAARIPHYASGRLLHSPLNR